MGFLVFPGIDEPIGLVPGHSPVEGISRVLMLTNGAMPGRSFHVAAHFDSADYRPAADWQFTEPHAHPFDEINLLLPAGDCLRYRYEVEGRLHEISGPCSVFLSAGTPHRMEPIEGQGIFVCIQLNQASR